MGHQSWGLWLNNADAIASNLVCYTSKWKKRASELLTHINEIERWRYGQNLSKFLNVLHQEYNYLYKNSAETVINYP